MTGAVDLPAAFGQYRVVEKLGEGGMGVVYLAVSPEFRLVAVKALRPWMVGGDESRSRFAREVALMRRVRGAHVGEVIDADVEADPAYLVTRYVRGPALPTAIADHGPLGVEALTDLAVGLLKALATVHAGGLVHRDVKPGNVLMSGREPVLIDFGLARAGDETRLTSTGMIAGTPGYLAPETIHGDGATTATDVHGWAATVAFAGTGRSPFGTGPDSVVLDRIRRSDHDTVGLPEPVSSAVLAALHDDPAKRPTIVEMLHELGGDEPVQGSPSMVPVAPPPPPRKHEPVTEVTSQYAPVSDTDTVNDPQTDIATDPGATEAFDPLISDRPDDADAWDADTDETEVASLADTTPTVADAARVPHEPTSSDDTVVMARKAPPPSAPPPSAPPPSAPPPSAPPHDDQPLSSQGAANPPREHPYAGDGAPLRAWPPRVVVMTAGLALVIMAGFMPWVGAAVLVVAMVTGRIVWRVRRRMYERTVRRGAGKHDRLLVGLGTPADLVLVILPSIGQAVVAIGAGVLVGMVLNLAAEAVGAATPLLVGAATAVVVAWWGPGAERFRHGIRVLAAPTERYTQVGWTVAAVFFITAWVFAVLWEVLQTSWWPGSDPPNPFNL